LFYAESHFPFFRAVGGRRLPRKAAAASLHFGQHSIRIGFFDHRHRHRDLKAFVRKRQRLGIAIAKLDCAFETLYRTCRS
jgi:hypothetical protein